MSNARNAGIRERALSNMRDNRWLEDLLARYRPVAAWLMREADTLIGLLPSPRIRSWGTPNPFGCPVHGGARPVFAYSLEKPGRVTCRIGGEEYPNADYPDPHGAGWRDTRKGSPTEGQVFPFTADAYRYLWSTLREACFSAALEYLLYEDRSAARACARTLAAMAAVYPRMDNRTCEAWAPRGWHVPLSEHIQEGIFFRGLAQAWLFIRESAVVTEQRAAIERDLLGHAGTVLRRVHSQHPTLHAHNTTAFLLQGIALCARAIESADLMDYAARSVDGAFTYGTWQDGFWNEGAVGYHAEVTRALCFVAEAIRPRRDLYRDASFRRMVDFLFDVRSLESGASLALGDTLPDVDYCSFFAPAARSEWKDSRYVMWPESLAWQPSPDPALGPMTPPSLGDIDAVGYLLTRPLEVVVGRAHESPDTLGRTGVSAGLSVLRQPAGTGWLEAMISHGPFCVGQTHGHSDKLALALFGQGRAWLEEIGQTDGYLIPVYAGWSQNTVSHATVVVDARRQEPHPAGRLYLSCQAPRVSVMDAAAEDAYPGTTSTYRRCVLLVGDPRAGSAYAVDVFRVRGGAQHDYSVHASSPLFEIEGFTPGAPSEGTLRGSDVAYGDAREFDLQDIMKYRGSGYQFLERPARGMPTGPWRAVWRDGERGLAVAMPGGDEVIVAEGRRFHRRENTPADCFRYLIVRREGNAPLESAYVAAFEVFARQPTVRSVERVTVNGSDRDTVACFVDRSPARDYVIHDVNPREERTVGPLRARGSCAYLSLRGEEMDCLFLLDGATARAEGVELALEASSEGVVESADAFSVVVRDARFPNGATLRGCKLLVERPDRGCTAFEVERVEGNRVWIRDGIPPFATGVVCRYDPERRLIESRSPLLKLATPGPQSRGLAVLCRDWKSPLRFGLQSTFRSHGGPDAVYRLSLEAEPERPPASGDPFTLCAVGPTDRVRVLPFACLERSGENAFRLTASCDVRLSMRGPAGARLWVRRGTDWVDCGAAADARVPCVAEGPGASLAVSLRAPV
jgi:hypothetical protein